MRNAWVLAVVVLVAGCSCSSKEAPKKEKPLSVAETASMQEIGLPDVVAKVKDPGGKVLLIVLWRANTEGLKDLLTQVKELDQRHAKAGLELLALDIDMMLSEVREKSLPLVAKVGGKLPVRAFQGDVEGLGALLDHSWGGQTPAVFLYDRTGKQVYKSREKGCLAEAAAKLPQALALAP
jgi:hypothetical protein